MDIATLLGLLAASFIILGLSMIFKRYKKKTVWVVEDNQTEIALLKLQLKDTPRIHFVFFESLGEIPLLTMLFDRPDGVITDYYLPEHNGDELIRWCKRNCIPAILVTGLDKEIYGTSTIRKQATGQHIESINQWLDRAVLHQDKLNFMRR